MKKHGTLADGLRAWLSRPEGEGEPVATNWTTMPSSNNPMRDGMGVERRWSARPTIGEIMAAVETGDIEKNKRGQTVRIGALRFSDGTQTEKAYKRGPDGKIVQYDARVPVGAMLCMTDAQDRMLGGNGPENRNAAYKAAYGGKASGNITRARAQQRKESPATKNDLRRMLATAIANTPNMPAVKRCPKGFPWKPSDISDLFIGFSIATRGKSTSDSWQDIAMTTA